MSNALGALFEFLFKYRPLVFAKGDLALGAPWPVLAVLAGAAVVAVPAVLSYRRIRGKTTPRDRMVLTGLRVGLFAVLALCLARPMLLLSEAVPRRNYVGVLLDNSRSMRIADRDGRRRADFVRDSLVGDHAAVLAGLRDRFLVRTFGFGGSASVLEPGDTLQFDARESRLTDALDQARQSLDAVPLSALVVVSDGADNARTPMADALVALRGKGIPVFTVGVGAERFARDIEVTRVDAAREVLAGGTIAVDVQIRQRGYTGVRLSLLVEDDGRVIARREVTLTAGSEGVTERVAARLDRPGARLLTFRVTPQVGEQVLENNAQQLLVRVRGGREKILYVEGEPRYEMRFIRAAVEADSNLQVVSLQRTAEQKFLRLGVDDGNELAGGFPATRATLFAYRAVVLGSVEASFFTGDQLQMLADFAAVRGGGVLFLGGRRAFAEGGYAGTPLADALPVVVEGGAVPDSLTFLADLRATLTPAGLGHAVAQLGDSLDPAAHWRALPAVTSVNRIRRVKPGAVTLVAGAVPAGGRAGAPGELLSRYEQPILVYQRFGRGFTVALPIQDSWTWQMDSSIAPEDQTFATFWRQLLRWIASESPGRVQGELTPEQANAGRAIEVRAVVTDSGFLRSNDAPVTARVTAPSGAVREVAMDWVVDRDGEYRGAFTPTEMGMHTVVVQAYGGTAMAAADTLVARVADLDDEFVNAEMRGDLLRRMSSETGGRFYTPATVRSLADDIALTRRGVTVVNRLDLWDMPAVFLLLVGLLAAEWSYRKARGLA